MNKLTMALLALAGVVTSGVANAACSDINYNALKNASNAVVRGEGGAGGFGLNMWVTVVDETGKVCEVYTTGDPGALASRSEWLGSRVISAQKANTSNAFSLNGVAISSGDLYAPVQPGGSLFGLQESNPVDANAAYQGNPAFYGTSLDPLRGKRVGGVNVFGGGLPLYKGGVKIGAIGVSGDTSCADHAFAWTVRSNLGMGRPAGVIDFETINYASEFDSLGDHPACGVSDPTGADKGFGPDKAAAN